MTLRGSPAWPFLVRRYNCAVMRSASILAFALSLAGQSSPPPSQPSASQPQQPVARATVQEVVLDLIVRDKKGKLIRDLRPEEIEILDEGAPQKPTALRLVAAADPAGRAAEAAASKVSDALRQNRLVALLFQGLDEEGRRRSREAALDLLRTELEPNVYMAVFAIDQRLLVLQHFTNNRELLKKAIERATTGHFTQLFADSEAVRKQLDQARTSQAASAGESSSSTAARGVSATQVAAATEGQMAQLTLNILSASEKLSRLQQSQASIFSILSLAREQASLPGRKTIVYFSDGLEVEEAMIEQFRSSIGAVNRAGVSVYGVDARGLTIESQTASATSLLMDAVGSSRTQQQTEGSVTADQVRALDTARGSIHANRQQSLETLSTSTGGFLIANTNDLRGPLQRIREDILTYYELSYVPPITEYDGKFRKVLVKVSRPNVRIQARNGYFALPPAMDPVLAYEMPLLHVLSASPLPKAFAFHAAAMKFGQREGKRQYALVLEVPLKEIAAAEDPARKLYRTHVSVLALVKDEQGQVVDRFGYDFPFQGPLDKLEEFRKRRFQQAFGVDLAPGRYTVESAAVDRAGELKASARRTCLVVPPSSAAVGISSLSLVRRVDQVTAPDTSDPFQFQDKRVVPMLDNTVLATPGRGLSFYLIVYPAQGDATKPQLIFELSKDGAPLGTVGAELPPPNEQGVIPYIASFPLEAFPPGQYELRAIVKQGAGAAEEKAVFNVEKPTGGGSGEGN